MSMTKHPRYPHTLEDLFLKAFVLLDDWLIAPLQRSALPKLSKEIYVAIQSWVIRCATASLKCRFCSTEYAPFYRGRT